MDIWDLIQKPLFDLIYVEYVLLVIICTEGIKKLFNINTRALHSKWITLGIGIVLILLSLPIHWESKAPLRYFASFCTALAFYDYILKVIKDKLNQRNK